jgi:LCP family protein required for cell wall assembly
MPRDESAGPGLPPHLDPRAGRTRPGAGRAASSPRRYAVAGRVLAAVLSVLVLGGSGWGWYLARVAEASVGRTDAIPTEGNTDAQGSDHAGKAMNLLLVGRDSRAGLTPEQAAEFSTGDPEGLLNTDTMILVHVPADGSAAAFVSIPRDLYVSIPGYGEAKLNSAFGRGYNDAEGSDAEKEAAGARLLIQTISGATGVQIDHFAEINLLGFINISSIVGGVEVNLCNATDDPLSGAHFEAGVQTISGAEALAFVRQRHGLPSELDRQVRQQVFLAGLIRNVLSENLLLNPVKQRQVIQQVGTSVTVDQGLNLFDLAAQMQSVKPDDITFQTIPGLADAVEDAGDVLEPVDPDALKEFFASLSGSPEPAQAAPSVEAADPGDVTVSVLNGSGVSGAAATAADALSAAGFDASSGGNAEAATDVTTISHAAGDEALAAAVAAQVPGAAVTVDDSLPAGTVQLVLGSDFQGVGAAVSAPVAATPEGTYATSERTAEDTSCIA